MPNRDDSKVFDITVQLGLKDQDDTAGRMSYSELSNYLECPHRWSLMYVKDHREYKPNLYTVFGSAIHTCLQDYMVKLLQGGGAKEADGQDWNKRFMSEFKLEYEKELETAGGEIFASESDLYDFYKDGVEILKYFLKKRKDYFSTRDHSLVGIEIPLFVKLLDDYNVYFKGFIDMVVKDKTTQVHTLLDIKTSTAGWNKWQKANKNKTDQLVLYKAYYSKQFGYSLKELAVEFFVVKRKLNENIEYAQKRIQTFSPSHGSRSVKTAVTRAEEFIKDTRTIQGDKIDKAYPALAGKNQKHCKYCEFKNNFELCPINSRIKETST